MSRATRQGRTSCTKKLSKFVDEYEKTLEIRRRVLGAEHPDTSASAWNLFVSLHKLDERAAARAVLERDLLWLLDRDPATFGADQRRIRGEVAEAVKESG